MTAKCQGPAPLDVGTMTAREPTMKVTRAQQLVSQNSHVIAKRCFTARETLIYCQRNGLSLRKKRRFAKRDFVYCPKRILYQKTMTWPSYAIWIFEGNNLLTSSWRGISWLLWMSQVCGAAICWAKLTGSSRVWCEWCGSGRKALTTNTSQCSA